MQPTASPGVRACVARGANTKEHEALNSTFVVSNKVLCLWLRNVVSSASIHEKEQSNLLACKQGEMPGFAQALTVLHLDLADCSLMKSFYLFSVTLFPIDWNPNLEVPSHSGSAFKAGDCTGAVLFLLHHSRHDAGSPSFSDTTFVQGSQLVLVIMKFPSAFA